jgi:hypothetical protein
MDEESIGLSAALEALRSELEEAWQAGQGRVVGFRVSDVTLTLQAAAQRDRDAGGKIRWLVFEAGGGAKSSSASTQTLVLTLTPSLRAASGETGPLDVAGEQRTPAG